MANFEGLVLLTPVGRMVQGDCFEPQKPRKGKEKFNKDGTPKIQYYVGLAISKADPEWPAFWAQVIAKGQQDMPQLSARPDFAWKLADGDHPENATKEGFPGHWILRIASGFAPRCVDNQPVPQPIEVPTELQRGCFLQMQISVRGNGDAEKPGVYLNLGLIMRVAFGPLITAGPPPEEVFRNRPTALPAGASLTPVGAPAGVVGQLPPNLAAAPPNPAATAAPAQLQPALQPWPDPATGGQAIDAASRQQIFINPADGQPCFAPQQPLAAPPAQPVGVAAVGAAQPAPGAVAAAGAVAQVAAGAPIVGAEAALPAYPSPAQAAGAADVVVPATGFLPGTQPAV